MHVIIYTDGGARGNPGPAGIGVVVYDEAENKKLAEISEYIGEQTNNVAEYTAVLMGLQKAKELGAETVHFRLDSELVVRQLNREYKVRNEHLAKIFVRIWNLMQEFQNVTYEHIRREKNKEADKLANDAMDKGRGI